MYKWRVTKYNPENRNTDGTYKIDEWTSFHDIGKAFNNELLDYSNYKRVEDAYIKVIELILSYNGISSLTITDLDKYNSSLELNDFNTPDIVNLFGEINNNKQLGLDKIMILARLILREELWCKLQNDKGNYIHFGYDYYMYIGSNTNNQEIYDEVRKIGLFIEEIESPYV